MVLSIIIQSFVLWLISAQMYISCNRMAMTLHKRLRIKIRFKVSFVSIVKLIKPSGLPWKTLQTGSSGHGVSTWLLLMETNGAENTANHHTTSTTNVHRAEAKCILLAINRVSGSLPESPDTNTVLARRLFPGITRSGLSLLLWR